MNRSAQFGHNRPKGTASIAQNDGQTDKQIDVITCRKKLRAQKFRQAQRGSYRSAIRFCACDVCLDVTRNQISIAKKYSIHM